MAAHGVDAFLTTERATGTRYAEFPPSPALAEFVACLWVRAVSPLSAPESVSVVPDGCADIITVDDRAPLLVGPDTFAHAFGLPSGIVITSLRLRPGALRGVIGCRVDEILESTIHLRDAAASATRLHADLQRVDTLGQSSRSWR